jgi:hypothetical protein
MGKGSNTVNIGNTSLTDTYLNGTLHVSNNAYTLPTVAPTSGQVLGYLGAGTTAWVTSGGGGIWGIANSSGIYTYYATWALAVAAATSGQVIELFADITENTVGYTLKNGVNINGNGHTISSNTVTSTFTDGGVTVICDVSNLIISKSLGGALSMTSTSSIITGNCKVIGAGAGDMCSVYGQLNGWVIVGSMSYPIALYSTGILSNITINNTGGFGIQLLSTTTKINNCYIKTSGTSILNSGTSGGIINNTTIISNGTAISTYTGEINNSSIQSNTSLTLTLGANSTANNCIIKSSTNNVVSAPLTSSFNNCTIIAEANAISGADINFNNCVLWSKIDWVLNGSGGGKIFNCKLTTGYNSINGYVINEPTSNTYVVDCILEVANSGTTAIRSTSTPTLYLSGNTVKGTTNFKSAGIVNGQTNTADAQGNIILN